MGRGGKAAAAIALVLMLGGCAGTADHPRHRGTPVLPEVNAVPANASVAFIGDSYVQGMGASSPEHSVAELIQAATGWPVDNRGSGGTGYSREVGSPKSQYACGREHCPSYLESLRALPPDIGTIVIFGGRNQTYAMGDALRADISRFYRSAREWFPRARIIATSPLWDYRAVPAQIVDMTQAVRGAAISVRAGFLDLGQPLEGRPDRVAPDGIHPNNAGQAAIAESFLAAISSLGPPG